MLTVPRRHVDGVNIALIAAACGLAHAFPYGLLLFSYAVLGPAHYLTQISWLHDRGYFVEARRQVLAIYGVLAVCLTFLTYATGFQGDKIMLTAGLYIAGLGFAVIAILPPQRRELRGPVVIVAAMLFALALRWPVVMICVAFLVPTILHIFVFTASFMWAGAVKARGRDGNKAAWLGLAALIAGAATFALPGLAAQAFPERPGLLFFRPLTGLLQDRLGLSAIGETQIFGFLSFAYTYHYLNWFSKAEVIHWNRIPRGRMRMIIFIYCVTIAAYAYDYMTGFLLIVFLSFLHVLLEFPLNMRTFAALARGRAAG